MISSGSTPPPPPSNWNRLPSGQKKTTLHAIIEESMYFYKIEYPSLSLILCKVKNLWKGFKLAVKLELSGGGLGWGNISPLMSCLNPKVHFYHTGSSDDQCFSCAMNRSREANKIKTLTKIKILLLSLSNFSNYRVCISLQFHISAVYRVHASFWKGMAQLFKTFRWWLLNCQWNRQRTHRRHIRLYETRCNYLH